MVGGCTCERCFWVGFIVALIMGFSAQRAVREWRRATSPTRPQLVMLPTARSPLQVFFDAVFGCFFFIFWTAVALLGLAIFIHYVM